VFRQKSTGRGQRRRKKPPKKAPDASKWRFSDAIGVIKLPEAAAPAVLTIF